MMRRRGPGLARTVARTAVVAGTASAVSGRVHRRQNERWAGQEAEQQAAAQQAQYDQQVAAQQQYAAEAPAEESYVAELEKLAQLKNQGILTEEEFQAKKKQILGI
jgi:hypothetical protein